MGLAVCVGALADLMRTDPEGAAWLRGQLAIVNALLGAKKLPEHVEPETLADLEMRPHVSSFPHAFLHHLRRAAAHRRRDPTWMARPFPASADPSRDPAVRDMTDNFDFHLLCHSDAEGFYVPIDFASVIFDHGKRGLAGAMLGSSSRLRAELVEVAPALGIELDRVGALDDAQAKRLFKLGQDEKRNPFFREHTAWLALHEAACASLARKTAIVFQ